MCGTPAGLGQERADRSNGDQLHGEPESRRISSTAINEVEIGPAEMTPTPKPGPARSRAGKSHTAIVPAVGQ